MEFPNFFCTTNGCRSTRVGNVWMGWRLGSFITGPWIIRIRSWVGCISLRGFSYIVGRCCCPKRVSSRRPLRIKWHRRTICRLIVRYISYSRSFMVLRNMVIHMLFSTSPLACTYYWAQNQQFSTNFSNQSTNFPVLNLYEQYSTDADTLLH